MLSVWVLTCIIIVLLCLRCRPRHPIVTADALFFLSFLLYLIPLVSLLLRGNTRDRVATFAQCTEWSHFAFQLFFRQSDLRYKNQSPLKFQADNPDYKYMCLVNHTSRLWDNSAGCSSNRVDFKPTFMFTKNCLAWHCRMLEESQRKPDANSRPQSSDKFTGLLISYTELVGT